MSRPALFLLAAAIVGSAAALPATASAERIYLTCDQRFDSGQNGPFDAIIDTDAREATIDGQHFTPEGNRSSFATSDGTPVTHYYRMIQLDPEMIVVGMSFTPDGDIQWTRSISRISGRYIGPYSEGRCTRVQQAAF